MNTRRPLSALAALFVLGSSAPASAQTVTTSNGLTLGQTIAQLVRPLAAAPVGEAIAFATALEVATTPFGTSSGGFVSQVDPSTGLRVRTATTFGPSFAERALTSGEGKVSIGVNFLAANYDRLGGLSLNRMQLASVTAPSPTVARSGIASLVVTSKTTVLSGVIGVTDRLDVGVAVPLVSVKVDGISWVQNNAGDVLLTSQGSGISSGVGDVAVLAKYRFLAFGGGQPDPGGLTATGTIRLPSGDKDNLRGLGVTRVLGSIIASSGRGRFRPHANAGFEWWSQGVDVVTDFAENTTVTARHQIQYAAGLEVEAAPKLTLNCDFLGRQILGGGQVGFRTVTPPANSFGVTSQSSAVALSEGIQKLTLVPGLKLNLKGTLLLSLNTLISLRDSGFHARFIPVVGVDLTK
jgi:hypothetical protein